MKKDLFANWSFPTAIRFGAGRLKELPDACQTARITHPLLVTDSGLAGSELVQRALQYCSEAGLPAKVYSNVQGNPTKANVLEGVKVFQAGNHDGVIAFGGGSGLDAGKTIAFCSGQTRPLWDFEDREDWWKRADANRIAPSVAICTTAGTGSEVGRASVITDPRDQTKKIIFHPLMLPRVAILDPELTLELPPHITAVTGMDAFAHNLEAYCSPTYHPMAEGIALEGIRLVHQWLQVAVREGNNLEARAHMMAASSMGAVAFQKGLGAIHSLSHPCGGILNTHHGLTNAVVMPYVLAFNRPAIEEKITRLTRYLGFQHPGFEPFLDWILDLRQELKIPHTLADLGMKVEHIERFSKMALVDPPSATNPIPLNANNLARLYRNAIGGH